MKFKDIWASQGENLIPYIDVEQLKELESQVKDGYKDDVFSRKGWSEKYAQALEIAMQVKKSKTFPWRNASNVRYPLMTMACTNYNARAYSALVKTNSLVKPFSDSAEHWQVAKRVDRAILKGMEYWDEEQDKLLMIQSLVGTVYKKTYANRYGVQSELVLPHELVIDYYARSVDSARRKTHELGYSKNKLETEFRTGTFSRPSQDLIEASLDPDEVEDVEDESRGLSRPFSDGEFKILEQCCWFDLDEDGYEEPYVVHLDGPSGQALRVASRFEKIFMSRGGQTIEGYDESLRGWEISEIKAEEFYTKYPFIPSMDGSILDIGFCHILLPINKAVDSILNQLIDAGTMSNVSGGLIANNVRVRSGKIEAAPNRWVRVDATGDALQKGIYPWPIKEPSSVLLALMQCLLQAGERVGSVTDAMTGENPGQNQAATTTMAVIEQGSQVYNSIYKRTWRSQAKEFRKIYILLQKKDPEMYPLDVDELCPMADPQVMSMPQRLLRAEALMGRVAQMPHLYGPQGTFEAERSWLEAMDMDSERLLQGSPEPPPNPDLIEFQHKQQYDTQMLQLEGIKTQSNAMKDAATIESKKVDDNVKVGRLDLDTAIARAEDGIKRAGLIIEDAGRRMEQANRDNAVSKDSGKKD